MCGARKWYELECRHCGRRFLEMRELLFHPCPSNSNARRSQTRQKTGRLKKGPGVETVSETGPSEHGGSLTRKLTPKKGGKRASGGAFDISRDRERGPVATEL
jgi:hypothetical protein